jgi:hypothetical protein
VVFVSSWQFSFDPPVRSQALDSIYECGGGYAERRMANWRREISEVVKRPNGSIRPAHVSQLKVWGSPMHSNTSRLDKRFGGRRWNVMWPAVLIVDGSQSYACTILDLSQTGARIDIYALSFRSPRVTLKCDRFGQFDAQLKWSRGGKAGLRFEATPHDVVEVLKKVVPGMGRREAPAPTREKRATFGRLKAAA